MRLIYKLVMLILCIPSIVHAQSSVLGDSLHLGDMPDILIEKTKHASKELSGSVQKVNEKLLRKMQAHEVKLFRKLSVIDSMASEKDFTEVSLKYKTLETKISNPYSVLEDNKTTQYIPRFDSLQTMLKFLQPLASNREQVDKALASIDELKAKLAQAEDIKSFISEREESIKNLVQLYTQLPSGITKTISKYSKEFYYYKERISGWKETLNDPQKIEETALKILNKVPAFKTFWQQNSGVAKIFGSSSGSVASFAGLQSRQAVMQHLQQQLGAIGLNPQQLIQEKLAKAQGELNKIKVKANELKDGSYGNGDAEQPEFKPNSEKNKSFLKRLDLGWNLQTSSNPVQSIRNFPSTNDLALSAGYKFNDRLVGGIGIAYKFGLGSGWKHISYSHEGIGLRSFIDFKISAPQKGIKVLFGNWWISGGYEMNYRTAIKSFDQLKSVSAWQPGGLFGVSKKIAAKSKFFKQANLQLLWDFLSYYQVPRTQPFAFRFGYNL